MVEKRQNGMDERPQINPEMRTRIAKSARQVAAYVNFLRWTANFRRDEVVKHPNHDRVMLLSPMQSGRFSFAIEGDILLLGVQDFEAAWMASMPFDCAYVSDRLYLSVEGVACMDAKLPPLALGIFVDDPVKRAAMSTAQFVQFIRVHVRDGRVAEVGGTFGSRFPVKQGDLIKQLVVAAKEKLRQQDMGRFF
jgi:hypothetical protein